MKLQYIEYQMAGVAVVLFISNVPISIIFFLFLHETFGLVT